jgi:surface protein
MSATGFTYKTTNNEEKSIIIDGENNTVNLQKFELITPAVSCREYVCYEFLTQECLQTAVDLWITDRNQALVLYSQINTWDVSKITDMSNLFEDKTEFNHNLSNWQTSQVLNMSGMFKNCSKFNRDISAWDVDNVVNFTDMFQNSKLETSLSNTKRSAIHSSFSQNQNWPYQWDDVSLPEAI